MEAFRHTDKPKILLEGFLQLLGRTSYQIILAFRVGFNSALCFLCFIFCQMWGKQAEHAGFTAVLHHQCGSRQGQLANHCCTKHSLTPSSPPSLCVFWCDFTHIPALLSDEQTQLSCSQEMRIRKKYRTHLKGELLWEKAQRENSWYFHCNLSVFPTGRNIYPDTSSPSSLKDQRFSMIYLLQQLLGKVLMCFWEHSHRKHPLQPAVKLRSSSPFPSHSNHSCCSLALDFPKSIDCILTLCISGCYLHLKIGEQILRDNKVLLASEVKLRRFSCASKISHQAHL